MIRFAVLLALASGCVAEVAETSAELDQALGAPDTAATAVPLPILQAMPAPPVADAGPPPRVLHAGCWLGYDPQCGQDVTVSCGKSAGYQNTPAGCRVGTRCNESFCTVTVTFCCPVAS